MGSDTKSRGRIARLILTDSTTTDDLIDETRSAPSIPRRDHSGDYSSSSKFVEAMNNPDWRRRRDAYSTGESTTTTTSGTDSASLRTRESSQTSAEQDLHISRVKGLNTSSWDSIESANHWRSSLDYSEAETRDKDVASVDEVCNILDSMQISDAQAVEEETHGLCTLLNRMNLMGFGIKDRPVSVIQLTPFSASDENLRHDGRVNVRNVPALPVARIQRVCGRPQRPQREPENLLSTTDLQDPTHPRPSSNRQEHNEGVITVKYQEERIERARDAVLKDPAVATIGHAHTETRNPILPLDQTRKNKELESRHAAFQRVLQKLQKGAGSREKITKGKSGDGLYHGHGPPWRPKPREQLQQDEEQRKLNSSDSGIGSFYTNGPRSKESSQYSGICIDPETLFKGLNPRAREFLSFNESFATKTESQDIDRLSDDWLTWNVSMDENKKEASGATDKPAETPSTNLNHSLPIMQPDDRGFQSTRNTSGIENNLGTGNTLGSGPGATPAMNPNPSQAANGYMPNVMAPPSFTVPFGSYQPPMYNMPGWQTSAATGYQLNLPTTIPMVQHSGYQLHLPTANPMLQQPNVQPNPYWINTTGSQMPYPPMAPQMGVSGCPPACPRPVPKPTEPNTIRQQKYEEWIERYKAYKPEYALECKERQKRRAQRQPMVKNMPPNQGPHREDQQSDGRGQS
ncbi:hypothetical protein FSARC_642 [Fusarium sarcochroum]|uniref:Uncharacterized protein n=1 Tax=Fusarium sarcochroum TaxID=1208366 RepID=A0A8H4UAY9_9HYPO|nr:hypothetical protein FSARC_642 [Fusarium sarcochroum]